MACDIHTHTHTHTLHPSRWQSPMAEPVWLRCTHVPVCVMCAMARLQITCVCVLYVHSGKAAVSLGTLSGHILDMHVCVCVCRVQWQGCSESGYPVRTHPGGGHLQCCRQRRQRYTQAHRHTHTHTHARLFPHNTHTHIQTRVRARLASHKMMREGRPTYISKALDWIAACGPRVSAQSPAEAGHECVW